MPGARSAWGPITSASVPEPIYRPGNPWCGGLGSGLQRRPWAWGPQGPRSVGDQARPGCSQTVKAVDRRGLGYAVRLRPLGAPLPKLEATSAHRLRLRGIVASTSMGRPGPKVITLNDKGCVARDESPRQAAETAPEQCR
jgi:hypothetical protein